MTTYRVIDVTKDGRGAIAALVVKEDTGKKLKDKTTLPKAKVIEWVEKYGDVFYKIDLTTGETGRVRRDPKRIQTIGDKDLTDNLG
ncbi:MAG TPA: hypothetical protein VIJ56_00535 [Acidimicrobiales bacterium]